MSDPKKPAPQSTGVPNYPDKTTGSETAATVRRAANHWADQKRSDLFDRGMQIIYGGTATKEKVRSR